VQADLHSHLRRSAQTCEGHHRRLAERRSTSSSSHANGEWSEAASSVVPRVMLQGEAATVWLTQVRRRLWSLDRASAQCRTQLRSKQLWHHCQLTAGPNVTPQQFGGASGGALVDLEAGARDTRTGHRLEAHPGGHSKGRSGTLLSTPPSP
jgi:hypothetical protein